MADTRNMTQEERAAARVETLSRLHQELTAQVVKLDGVEAWQEWLRLARRFHHYSFNNTLLILAQRPGSTLVAGFGAWKLEGRFVRSGEKGIKVLAPVKKVVDLYNPDGTRVLDANGRPRYRWEIAGVKVVHVWDASQVDPSPRIPPEPQLLVGEAPFGLWDSLASLVQREGFVVTRGDCGGPNGFTNFADREIRVRDDLDDAQAVKTLAHELGHVFTIDAADPEGYLAHRELREVEAESIAYMVTSAHGLDSSQYTFSYVAGWASRATGGVGIEEIIKSTGERVMAAADRILSHTKSGPAAEEQLLDTWARDVLPVGGITPDPDLWESVPVASTAPAGARTPPAPGFARTVAGIGR